MNKELVGVVPVIYMACGFKTDTQRAWIRLSNGMSDSFFQFIADKEHVDYIKATHKEGDQVDVEFHVNPFNDRMKSVVLSKDE